LVERRVFERAWRLQQLWKHLSAAKVKSVNPQAMCPDEEPESIFHGRTHPGCHIATPTGVTWELIDGEGCDRR
jgi:hypothetical protein